MRILVSLLLTFVAAIPAASAQDAWPTRPVKVIMPAAPGGIGDIIARIIGNALQEKLGAPIIVENRPGSAGNIGTAFVARAASDGYTMLAITNAFASNLGLYQNPGYQLDDFEVAAIVAKSPNVIIAAREGSNPNLLEILAKGNAGAITYSTPGIGTTPHLTAERIFNANAMAKATHVPFNGAGPAVTAVMAGQVPFGVVAMSSALQPLRDGKVTGVAVADSHRLPAFPDMPTVAELGLGAVEDATTVILLFPRGTPASIVQTFNTRVNEILASGALDERLASIGATPVIVSIADANAAIAGEVAKWKEVIRAANITVE